MSLMHEGWRNQQQEGADPDDYEMPSALDIVLEEGDAEIVIDFLRGMLARHGMTGEQIDTALEAECNKWLADQTEAWCESHY